MDVPVAVKQERRIAINYLTVFSVVGIVLFLLCFLTISIISHFINQAILTEDFVELGSLDLACRAFKEKFGDYPPDGTDAEAVDRFLAKAFPKYRGGLPPGIKLNPGTAIVFWLGGMRDTSGKFIGFSANPENPFDDDLLRFPPFILFDSKRVKSTSSGLQFIPHNGKEQSEPYVYFRSRPDGTYSGSFGVCKPCLDVKIGPSGFANPNSFQIRSPGRDGKHGSGIQYPSGADYDEHQADDQGNFCQKLSFQDAIP
jgi:hypothetical protein